MNNILKQASDLLLTLQNDNNELSLKLRKLELIEKIAMKLREKNQLFSFDDYMDKKAELEIKEISELENILSLVSDYLGTTPETSFGKVAEYQNSDSENYFYIKPEEKFFNLLIGGN